MLRFPARGVAELGAVRGLLGVQGALDAFATPGEGPPVLLIPGFLAGDQSLEPLARRLSEAGYHPHPAGMQRNVDCSERAVTRLADRLRELGRPAALIGHSRGGMLAHVLARRHPELVAGVLTIAAPRRSPLALHPVVLAPALSLGVAGSLGIDGLVRYSCAVGRCCRAFRRDLAAPVAPRMPYLAVYSRRDGLVDWRACQDPAGRHVEVHSSHCGMAEDRVTLHVAVEFLDGLAAPERAAAA
jgi:pimeloyl-ACP methyl ester carboxylesterase